MGLGQLTSSQAGLEQGWSQQQLDADLANQQAWIDSRGIEAGTYNAAMGANAQLAQANLDAQAGKKGVGVGDVGSAAMALGAIMSDPANKQEIETAKREAVREFVAGEASADPYARSLADVPAREYSYRDSAYAGSGQAQPIAAPGERVVGFTTDDLQRAGYGDMVQQTPQGEAVDVGRAASTALAGTAENQRAIQDLEREYQRILRELESPSELAIERGAR
jgi:hypothetical protein